MDLAHTPFWRKSVLTGEWRDLCLVSWAVEPERLAPYIPAGLELDLWQEHAFVSLVALRFVRPRVLGIGLPRWRVVPQINFRCYVREGPRRGVLFLREDAPPRAMVWGARALYGEPFVRGDVDCTKLERDGTIELAYVLHHDGNDNRLVVHADSVGTVPPEDSEAFFFEQRPFGFRAGRGTEPLRYGVTHGAWTTHRVRDVELQWDFARLYGPSWGVLAERKPWSVLLADGSRIQASLPE